MYCLINIAFFSSPVYFYLVSKYSQSSLFQIILSLEYLYYFLSAQQKADTARNASFLCQSASRRKAITVRFGIAIIKFEQSCRDLIVSDCHEDVCCCGSNPRGFSL